MRISDWSSDVCSSDLLALACASGEIFHLACYGRDALRVSFFDDRCNQSARDGHGDRNICPLKLEHGVASKLNIATRCRHQGQSLSLDEPIVDRHLHTVVAELIVDLRSEEHTSELQSLMRISYAVFCLKKK